MDDAYYTTTTTTASPETTAAIGIMYLVLFVLFIIPSVIVMWKLYKKAGKPGWAAIVPFYNTIVMADIARLGIGWAIAAIFVPFVNLYVLYKFAQQYDRGLGFWLLVIFLPLVALFLVGKANYKGTSTEPALAGPVSGQPVYAQPQQPTPTAPEGYQQPQIQQPTPQQAPGQNNTPGGYPQA